MKEVDCVHCMGVSSQFKRIRLPANSEHTVLWRRRNVSVMLVIEEVGTANTHISAISTGLLKLYLLCHLSTLNWTL